MNATSTTADIKLAGWQVRYQQRSFWRNRRAAFFSIVFPRSSSSSSAG